jgi:hypothetical protein
MVGGCWKESVVLAGASGFIAKYGLQLSGIGCGRRSACARAEMSTAFVPAVKAQKATAAALIGRRLV